jgi:D-alanyl-D-alanine carboxypeptidase
MLLLLPQTDVYADERGDNGLLWLINQDKRLNEDYVPANLKWYAGLKMHPDIIEPYKQMLAAMRKDGLYGLRIQSAYRDFSHQRFLFDTKAAAYRRMGYGESESAAFASRSVMYPGASEHQSGLALDVTMDGTLRQSFGDTRVGKWIAENCQRFGFILRYPSDKTDVTQIIYEPWHLRYVGVPHAAFMKELNLCLEEYIGCLADNGSSIYWVEPGVSYYLIEYTDEPGGAYASADSYGSAGYITTVFKTIKETSEVRRE